MRGSPDAGAGDGQGPQLGRTHDQVGVDPVVGGGFGFDGLPRVPLEQPAFAGVGEHRAHDRAGAADAAGGQGARLVRGLEGFFLDRLADAGYTELVVPLMVNAASATATGQLPDKEGQMYQVQDGYYLIPTSEVAITNLHRDEILDTDALPFLYTAYSACFRREAGSYGKDVRGLNRVHQFDKVEMVAFTTPEASYDALEAMTATSEAMLEALGLGYRRLLMCTGDMGFASAKTYDIEVWLPGQDTYREISSCSVCGDFQGRRMNARYRGKDDKATRFVHTLNGSGLAFPRTIACILEHYQQPDGTVVVPDVLRTYVGSDRIG